MPQTILNTPAKEAPEANDRAVIGGNEPPLEERIGMEFRDALIGERPDFMERYDQIIDSESRVEINDDTDLGKAGDLINMYRAAGKFIGETHEALKKPYLEGGRAVDAEKKRLLGPIEEVREKVQGKMNAFAAKKAARERAERQEREAEERRQALAARAAEEAAEKRRREAEEAGKPVEEDAPPPPPPVAVAPTASTTRGPTRSDAGSTVSSRSVWNSKVDDYTVAFIAVEDNEKVREAIDKAIAAQVRAGKRTIEGVSIWETAQAVAR